MASYSRLNRPEAETFLPSLGNPSPNPTALTSKSLSLKATVFLRIILVALCPVVILSFNSRTDMRHIILWPCIILFITFAINLAHILFIIIGKLQDDRKMSTVVVALTDIVSTVAVTTAVYIVTWKRPRGDRAESLIALVMGFIIGVIPFIIAGAEVLQKDYDISLTPTKRVQLPLEITEEDVSFESPDTKYSPNMEL